MPNPAFAFLNTLRFDASAGGNAQQINVSYQGIISDGVTQLDFASSFIYDNTLSQPVNLSNAKDALLSWAQANGFPGLTKPNIKFNLQFN